MSMRTISMLGLMAMLGCSGGGTEPQAAATPAPQAAPAPAPVVPQGPPKPAIEDNTFRLAFEGTQPYTAGQPGALKVVLEARGGYHVNQDYPIRIDLKAPEGVKLTKPSLVKGDAASFGEKSASFDVGFTADKGAHDLVAAVDFAVCTAETCVPDQRTIAIALNVQ